MRLPNPNFHGWKVDSENGQIAMEWTDEPAAPDALLQLTYAVVERHALRCGVLVRRATGSVQQHAPVDQIAVMG